MKSSLELTVLRGGSSSYLNAVSYGLAVSRYPRLCLH